jgi:hypothetical protein
MSLRGARLVAAGEGPGSALDGAWREADGASRRVSQPVTLPASVAAGAAWGRFKDSIGSTWDSAGP